MCFLVQVTASGDTTIGQWDVVRGESVATYKSHTGSVKSVDVKRDEPSEPYTYYTVLMYISSFCSVLQIMKNTYCVQFFFAVNVYYLLTVCLV